MPSVVVRFLEDGQLREVPVLDVTRALELARQFPRSFYDVRIDGLVRYDRQTLPER